MTPRRGDCAPLAGKSTLSRLELSATGRDDHKARKIVVDNPAPRPAAGGVVRGELRVAAGGGGAGSGRHRHSAARGAGGALLPRLLPRVLLHAAAVPDRAAPGAGAAAERREGCGDRCGGRPGLAAGPAAGGVADDPDHPADRLGLSPGADPGRLRAPGERGLRGRDREERPADPGDGRRDGAGAGGDGRDGEGGAAVRGVPLRHPRFVVSGAPGDREGGSAPVDRGGRRAQGEPPLHRDLTARPDSSRARALRAAVLRPRRRREPGEGAQAAPVLGTLLLQPLRRQHAAVLLLHFRHDPVSGRCARRSTAPGWRWPAPAGSGSACSRSEPSSVSPCDASTSPCPPPVPTRTCSASPGTASTPPDTPPRGRTPEWRRSCVHTPSSSTAGAESRWPAGSTCSWWTTARYAFAGRSGPRTGG